MHRYQRAARELWKFCSASGAHAVSVARLLERAMMDAGFQLALYRLHSGRPGRVEHKDAADVLRLMQTTRPTEVGARLALLAGDPMAGPATATAIGQLEHLFSRRGSPCVEMAARAVRLAAPAERVEAICIAYTASLLAAARPTP